MTFPLQQAATVAARAFYDDPLFGWLFPFDSRRLVLLEHTMRSLIGMRVDYGHVELDRATDPRAVFAGDGPETRVGTLREARFLVPNLVRGFADVAGTGHGLAQLRRINDGLRLLDWVAKLRPTGPHLYVSVLTVDPDHQRAGLGGKLLRGELAKVDRHGLPAHLETARPENVGYYRRFGFEVAREAEFRGSPPLWVMTRPPRADHGGGS